MVDISRDPRWGRVSEGNGEDPFLGAMIAEAMVRLRQGLSIHLSDPGSRTVGRNNHQRNILIKCFTGNFDTGGRLEFLCRFAGITSNNRAAVENVSLLRAGMVVLASISLVITPPNVSIPIDNGVTSNNTTPYIGSITAADSGMLCPVVCTGFTQIAEAIGEQ